MANKRMFNKTVVDSDAFLDMPQTTQNLYFHLNMRADDDGFLDNPKKVMRTIGANQNDLEILLAKRYILAFDNGVVVIKHWRLHNSIRKDRYKPTLYQEQIKTLIEKDSGVYTEAYKMLEQNELEEWQPNGNQMATDCQPVVAVDKNRLGLDIDLDKKEKSNKKEKSSPFLSASDPTYKIDSSVNRWNAKDGLPKTRKLTINLGEKARDIIETVKLYSADEIHKAIDNYHEIFTNQDKYKPIAVYGDVFGFLKAGIEKYWDESSPFQVMAVSGTSSGIDEETQRLIDNAMRRADGVR